MSNILKTPSTRAKIGYNGFDMSHLEKFSSTTGELLPVHFDLLQPGDKVTCGIELKTRTMELDAAAMVHIKEHVDWFFVPMTQLYTMFGDWYFGIQDFKTSFLDVSSTYSSTLPYVPASQLNALKNSVTYDYWGVNQSSWRLMDMLGIPMSQFGCSDSSYSSGFVTSVSPVFACAYQKIWFDYYRNTNYQQNDPKYYSLDRFSSSGIANDYIFFTLRYRSADKDFFNNIFPSPVIGSASLDVYRGNSLYNSFNQWLVSGLSFYGSDPVKQPLNAGANSQSSDTMTPQSIVPDVANPYLADTSNNPLPSRYGAASRADVQTFLNPTAIRTSFALQKLLEVTRRGAKHYDAQVLAHFGVEVPQGLSGEVYYLGSQDGDINIGDVIATSSGSTTFDGQTLNTPLGKVSGKGYGYTKGDKIRFEAPCHGVLMALYSANVERDYDNRMLDRLNTYINRSDWFTPVFDNLGMQPLFTYQGVLTDSAVNNSILYGWQYRYSELKYKYNRVSGNLSLGRSNQSWSSTYIAPAYNRGYNYYIFCSPYELDSVMLVPYAGLSMGHYESQGAEQVWVNNTNATMYYQDPLIHELYVDCKKSSKMSTYGLEQL